MNNVPLPSNLGLANHGPMRHLAWALGLALCLFSSSGLWAAAVGGSTTCYNCEIFSGVWYCDSGGVFGGTECTVKQSSCTVKGDCSGGGSIPIVIDLPEELVQEIAGIDGGAAATLVRLREMQTVPEKIQVGWLSAEITTQDVAGLLAGGDLASRTPGKASRFDVQVVLLDEDNAAIVIQPAKGSDAQNFNEMAVFLERNPATGLHHGKSWFLQ